MRVIKIYKSILLLTIVVLVSSCGFDCVTKKTGIHKSSMTIEESRENGVFLFQVFPSKKQISLDSNQYYTINEAWVEHSWRYECVDNKAVVRRDSNLQLVIESPHRKKDSLGYPYFFLMEQDLSHGCEIYSRLCFSYKMQDSLYLVLRQDEDIVDEQLILRTYIDTIFFTKTPNAK